MQAFGVTTPNPLRRFDWLWLVEAEGADDELGPLPPAEVPRGDASCFLPVGVFSEEVGLGASPEGPLL